MGSASLALLRARLAALRSESDPRFDDVVTGLRSLGDPYWLAVALLDHASWLVTNGSGAEAGPLLDEARAIFERLRAAPSLERVAALEAVRSPAPASTAAH